MRRWLAPMIDASDLSSFVTVAARRFGTRAAVCADASALSFGDLDRQATRWATAMIAHGIGPGSRVGLLAANGPEWMVVAFASWRAGATLVPLSTFATARELGELLAHAELDLLFISPQLGQHDLLQRLAESRAALASGRVVALGGTDSNLVTRAETWLAAGGQTPPPGATADSLACLLYTSGTTGRPKGVLLSHRAILATVGPTAERSGLGETDVMLSTLPLFWVAGLVIRALPTLACGSTLVLMESFSPAAALAALRQHTPTALHLRPPQVGQLLDAPGFSPELLARVRAGNGRSAWFAGKLPATAHLITGYGMTEMSGYVTALDWNDGEDERREGIGTPLPGVELRIVGVDGQVQANGSPGRVQVRGPGMFDGYFKEPANLGRTADGWFDTGDVGSLDHTGKFRFVGRDKDLLRIKGINVAPVEVEAVLANHPGVEAAYVVGLPPDGFEQELVALIVARQPTDPPTLTALRQHAARELSVYKRPQQYDFLQRGDVPLGGTSKPRRDELARLAEERLQHTRV